MKIAFVIGETDMVWLGSWAAWTGIIYLFTGWFEVFSWSDKKLLRDIRYRTYILWYHRLSHDSAKCKLIDRCSSSQNFTDFHSRTESYHSYTSLAKFALQSRLQLNCEPVQPTLIKLTKRLNPPQYVHDVISSNPGSGYL